MIENESNYTLAQRMDVSGYLQRMNNSADSKVAAILQELPDVSNVKHPLFLSIGAGSGKVENAISEMTGATVCALDVSLPMIETLKNGMKQQDLEFHSGRVVILQADATHMPFRPESVSAIFASSVLHEIITFKDKMKYGPNTERFFRDTFTVLKPNGRLIIRDFILPPDSEREILLEIGVSQNSDEKDPAAFLRSFGKRYKGQDTPVLHAILQSEPSHIFYPHETIQMSLAEALEIVVHYSWSKRFREEVRERYFHGNIHSYPARIQQTLATFGFTSRVVHTSLELQQGYTEHINTRFTLRELDGTLLSLPPFTGVLTIEKN